MSKKVFITGIAGFAGSYLAELLLAKNFSVSGLIVDNKSSNLDHLKEKLNIKVGNLLDKDSILKIISEIRPDIIYHLAGFTIPSLSYDNPIAAFENNVFGQLNIFEAVKHFGLSTIIVITGSSDEYGIVKNPKKPVSEDEPLNPTSPYGVSKIAQDFCASSYFLTYKMAIVRLRPFPHFGPRMNEKLSIASFAKQIALIEKGVQEKIIKVGNLEPRKDYTDVRDMVQAYFLASQKCQAGEVYNIGSGKTYSLSQILEFLLSLSKVKIKVEVDKSLFRPVDIPEIICNSEKFRKATGWEPKVKMEETLRETLDYWRRFIN